MLNKVLIIGIIICILIIAIYYFYKSQVNLRGFNEGDYVTCGTDHKMYKIENKQKCLITDKNYVIPGNKFISLDSCDMLDTMPNGPNISS